MSANLPLEKSAEVIELETRLAILQAKLDAQSARLNVSTNSDIVQQTPGQSNSIAQQISDQFNYNVQPSSRRQNFGCKSARYQSLSEQRLSSIDLDIKQKAVYSSGDDQRLVLKKLT